MMIDLLTLDTLMRYPTRIEHGDDDDDDDD